MNRLVWHGNAIKKQVLEAGKQGVSEVLEFILQEANNIAPLDEGTLIRSGNVDIEVSGTEITGSVYYDTPYAARLHEHPEYNFQHGRQGKYLERTITNKRGEVIKYLKNNYGHVFK